MILLTELVSGPRTADATLTLPFHSREKSRLRATLDDGREVGLLLPRGSVLRSGQLLSDGKGLVVRVHAAKETVSTVRSPDPTLLSRAAYHLGNRHVPVQIGEGFLRFGHDHVLDAMVRQFGLEVEVEEAPFEPESGAYEHGHADHGHSHSHAPTNDEDASDHGHRHSH